MHSIATRVHLILAIATTQACAGQVAQESAAVDQQTVELIRRELGKLGLANSNIVIDTQSNKVLVDKDMVFERDKLLSGAYTDVAPRKDGTIEKGFFHSKVDPSNVGNIRLETVDLSPQIYDAVRVAAWYWNESYSAVNIREENTGPVLRVESVSMPDWRSGNRPCVAVDHAGNQVLNDSGCAFSPSNGNPGSVFLPLFLEPVDDELGSVCYWTDSSLELAAAHEIGHALGLAHLDDPGTATWINGSCAFADAGECSSIMNSHFAVDPSTCEVNTAISPVGLTVEDKNAIRQLYPRP